MFTSGCGNQTNKQRQNKKDEEICYQEVNTVLEKISLTGTGKTMDPLGLLLDIEEDMLGGMDIRTDRAFFEIPQALDASNYLVCDTKQNQTQKLDFQEYEFSSSKGGNFEDFNRLGLSLQTSDIAAYPSPDIIYDKNNNKHFKFKINKTNNHYYLQSFLQIKDFYQNGNEVSGSKMVLFVGRRVDEVNAVTQGWGKLTSLYNIGISDRRLSTASSTSRRSIADNLRDTYSKQLAFTVPTPNSGILSYLSAQFLLIKIMHQIKCITQNQNEKNLGKMRIIKTVIRFNHTLIGKLFTKIRKNLIDYYRNQMFKNLEVGVAGDEALRESVFSIVGRDPVTAPVVPVPYRRIHGIGMHKLAKPEQARRGGGAGGGSGGRKLIRGSRNTDIIYEKLADIVTPDASLAGFEKLRVLQDPPRKRPKIPLNSKNLKKNWQSLLNHIHSMVALSKKNYQKNTIGFYKMFTQSLNLPNKVYSKNSTLHSANLVEIEMEIDFK